MKTVSQHWKICQKSPNTSNCELLGMRWQPSYIYMYITDGKIFFISMLSAWTFLRNWKWYGKQFEMCLFISITFQKVFKIPMSIWFFFFLWRSSEIVIDITLNSGAGGKACPILISCFSPSDTGQLYGWWSCPGF